MTQGMPCPKCSMGNTQVKDTRSRSGGILRRRRCPACGERFSTLETVVVDKRGGRFIGPTFEAPPQPDHLDAIRRAINFVADAHAKLKKELG